MPHSLVQRAKIVLLAAAGRNNKSISQSLKLQEETVGMWRKRWLSAVDELAACEAKYKALRPCIETVLADAPRPGIAPTFTPEQVCQIIALACETPPEYLSHWTRITLAEEAMKRGIVKSISLSIMAFLDSGTDKTASLTLLAESCGRR